MMTRRLKMAVPPTKGTTHHAVKRIPHVLGNFGTRHGWVLAGTPETSALPGYGLGIRYLVIGPGWRGDRRQSVGFQTLHHRPPSSGNPIRHLADATQHVELGRYPNTHPSNHLNQRPFPTASQPVTHSLMHQPTPRKPSHPSIPRTTKPSLLSYEGKSERDVYLWLDG